MRRLLRENAEIRHYYEENAENQMTFCIFVYIVRKLPQDFGFGKCKRGCAESVSCVLDVPVARNFGTIMNPDSKK